MLEVSFCREPIKIAVRCGSCSCGVRLRNCVVKLQRSIGELFGFRKGVTRRKYLVHAQQIVSHCNTGVRLPKMRVSMQGLQKVSCCFLHCLSASPGKEVSASQVDLVRLRVYALCC